MVWLFNDTGKSVFAVAVCHATMNAGWLLFPNCESHYHPRVSGPVAAVAASIVTLLSGPRTLARLRTT